MRVSIKDIQYKLPECVVTNDDLHNENPSWNMDQVANRSGVLSRHIARKDETALDLALEACTKLFSENENARGHIDGILFSTQSPDYIMPSNACVLHSMLGLPESVLAFDYSLGCAGYIYGLALARGLIQTGMASNILLVTADTYSKFVSKQDRSTRVVFGDGAAVSWIAESNSSLGLQDIQFATSGDRNTIVVPAGGFRTPRSEETGLPIQDEHGNMRTQEELYMDGRGVLDFINTKVSAQIYSLLGQNSLTTEDIDLFVFHQASKVALDSLSETLGISEEKTYRNLSTVGNTASASIPIALKDAWDDGRISPGDKLLLSGFGVGLSWASALMYS